MINGTEYAFEDVKISFLSRSLRGFVSFSYGANKAYTNIHGRATYPSSEDAEKKMRSPRV